MAKLGTWIRRERRLAIYIRDGFKCLYCRRDLRDANSREITLDHLRPRCLRGTNKSSNLITACCSCNSSRQSKPWRKFAGDELTIRRINRHRRRVLNIDLARTLVMQ